MKEVLFIESLMNEKTSQLNEAVELAWDEGLKLSTLFVIPLHPDVSDWMEVHGRQVKEAQVRIEAYGRRMAAELEAKGQDFRWRVVMGTGDAILEAISEFTPVDVILSGKLDFDALALKGIHNLEELSSQVHFPILPVERLASGKAPRPKISILRFGLFGVLSAASYFLFFPNIDRFNHALFMKGTILGAFAVMVIVAVHAYIYGSFTEYLPRFMGLDKGGHDH